MPKVVALLVSLVLVSVAARAGAADTTFPTRGLIAFACDGCGVPTYVAGIRPNGKGLRNLGLFTPVRWSPDGQSLVYAWNGSIIVHRLAGSVDRFLTNPHGKVFGGDRDPVWFPDGHTILFVRGDQPAASLWTVDASGRGARRLARAPSGAMLPDVSPDGRRIIYADQYGYVRLVRSDGTGGRSIGRSGPTGFEARWSPDGKQVAFVGGAGKLQVLTLAGGAVHEVHAGDDQPGAFAWSPDGRWLAVSEEHDYDCGDPTDPCSRDELWIAAATGHASRRIYTTPEEAGISSLDWSGTAH
jgi:dipeptidyl aminopeptidase/acylaminoacyl peptidase